MLPEFGICDWVLSLFFSRWAEQNVDPSLFPKELMANASDLVGDEEVVFFLWIASNNLT